MSTSEDSSERAAQELLEQIAAFDRQEEAVGECPQPWWDVGPGQSPPTKEECAELSDEQNELLGALMAPISEARTASILDAVMAERTADQPAEPVADAEATSAPSSLTERRSRSPWLLPGVTSAAIAIAASLVFFLSGPKTPDPATFDAVGPYRSEVTALVLGGSPPPPSGRVYGPGDEFVLSLVPTDGRPAAAPARLVAVPAHGGYPIAIDATPRVDDRGVIELRQELAAVLSPGEWRLHVEVGSVSQCAQAPTTCFQDNLNVVVVDH